MKEHGLGMDLHRCSHVFAVPSSFLVATFMSLILGHITTACHRYAHKLGEYGVEGDASRH